MKNYQIQFKAKLVEIHAYDKDLNPIQYKGIRIPKLQKSHLNLNVLRGDKDFSGMANSNLICPMLERSLDKICKNRKLNLEALPEGIEVEQGFLCTVTISGLTR